MKPGLFEKLFIRQLMKAPKSEIRLCVNSDEQLYDSFSVLPGGQNTYAGTGGAKINDGIIEYLKKETLHIPRKNGLAITVGIPGKTPDKMAAIEKLVKKNIIEHLSFIKRKIKRINRTSFTLALIGMFLIGFTQVFRLPEKRYPLNEFIIVMSWVFMWKAVELFFFERMKLTRERTVLMKIFYAELR